MFLINGISYLLSAFLECFITIPSASKGKSQNTHILNDLKEGFNFVVSQRKIFIIIIVIGITHLFIGSLMIALPVAYGVFGVLLNYINIGTIMLICGIILIGMVFILNRRYVLAKSSVHVY